MPTQDDVAGDAVTRARANLIEIAYRDEIRTVLVHADDLRVVLREFTRQAERIKELEAERDAAVANKIRFQDDVVPGLIHRAEADEKRNAELEARLAESVKVLELCTDRYAVRAFLATLKEKHNADR